MINVTVEGISLAAIALLVLIALLQWKKLFEINERFNTPQTPQVAPGVTEIEILIKMIRGAVVEQILGDNCPEIFDAIGAQRKILADHNRNAIMILLNEDSFKKLLIEIFPESELTYIDSMAENLIEIGTPVGFLGNLPIYVSLRLVDAPVFVVGDYKWDYRR